MTAGGPRGRQVPSPTTSRPSRTTTSPVGRPPLPVTVTSTTPRCRVVTVACCSPAEVVERVTTFLMTSSPMLTFWWRRTTLPASYSTGAVAALGQRQRAVPRDLDVEVAALRTVGPLAGVGRADAAGSVPSTSRACTSTSSTGLPSWSTTTPWIRGTPPRGSRATARVVRAHPAPAAHGAPRRGRGQRWRAGRRYGDGTSCSSRSGDATSVERHPPLFAESPSSRGRVEGPLEHQPSVLPPAVQPARRSTHSARASR